MVAALFDDLAIGDLTIPNRVVMPPMTTHYATEDGHATDQTVEYYRERAAGGTGLIIFEATYPCEPHPDRHLLTEDSHVESLRAVTDAVHDEDGAIAVQLNPSRATGDEYDAVAPSDVTVPLEGVPDERREVRGLTTDEIEGYVERFAAGVRRAKAAGFDGIEIHGASGYLVHQFFSPVTNHRDDEYGGNLKGRTRFARELIAAAREATDSDLPVWIRIAGDEFLDGGFGPAEAKRIAQCLEAAGSAALHVTAGHQWSEGQAYGILSGYEERGLNIDLAETVGAAVDVPVMAVGRINDVELAAEIVAEDRADLVAMGRAHIADPHFVRKASAGQVDRIRQCVGGLEGCRDMVFPNYPMTLASGMGVSCTVNALAGNEWKTQTEPATDPKAVTVVGGGPAGLEAARIAGKRGHDVTVYERRDHVGGQVRWMAGAPTKAEHGTLLEFFETELAAYDVTVETGVDVNPDDLTGSAADHLVIAVGSEPSIPLIEGFSAAVADGRVLTVEDVLSGDRTPASAAILGGTEAAVDVAVYLRHQEIPSTVIVEPDEELLPLRSPITKKGFRKRLDHPLIDLVTGTRVREITADGVGVVDIDDNTSRFVDRQSVILARDRTPTTNFAERIDACMPFDVVGDATGGGDLYSAIHDGARIGRSL